MPDDSDGNSAYTTVVASLPNELRSVDAWCYPGGLSDYMSALSEFIGSDRRVGPVMNAAGLSVADWCRAAIERDVPKKGLST